MESLTLLEINEAINGELIKKGEKELFNNVSTDTRTLKPGDVFIALRGENFNGSAYIEEAYKKGASLCIVDEISMDLEELNRLGCAVIKVHSGREALKDLATYYRKKLNIKVIGITGSTGKTSTKDLTAAALSKKFKVFKTKGNFNNDIGLPLMLLSIDNSYDIAVLEMGMSNLNEIHTLASIAKPDIALITNIGVSHLENLKTRENILKAKMEITDFFKEDNILIVNADNDYLEALSYDKKYKLIKIGLNAIKNELKYEISDIINSKEGIKFKIHDNNTKESEIINISTPGLHNILNGQLGICAARELGLTFDEIKEGLKNINNTSMRLELIEKNHIKIINDSYNASPDSMKAAIDYMGVLKGKRNIAILGTMKELGEDSYELHKEIGAYAKKNGVQMLLVVGEFNSAYEEGFGCEINKFHDNEELGRFYNNIKNDGDVVLVKASRSMKFENIVTMIE